MDPLKAQPVSQLWLNEFHWEQMRADVGRRAPEEACGLVAGRDRHALAVFPVDNALHSPVRYRIDPQEQLNVFLLIEEKGWELLAIYHSHPKGPAGPSTTDIQEAYYPQAVYLIWSQVNGDWHCRGYSIREGQVSEVLISVIP